MAGILADDRRLRRTAPILNSTRLFWMEGTLLSVKEGNHVSIMVPGEGIEPS